ncbi:MAG: ADOP family duplicated permease, partial [Vicinamibacteria bacterium]
RLAVVWHTFGLGQSLPAVNALDYRDYKERGKLFEDFTHISGFETVMQANSNAELVRVGTVAANFFPFLGVEPALGRQFRDSEDVPGAARVVWIDHDLWQRHFGGSPTAIGKTVELEGAPAEVVGVLPRDFELHLPAETFLVGRPQIFRPSRIDWANQPARNNTGETVLARVKTGVPFGAAAREIETIAAGLRREVRELDAADLRASLIPLKQDVVKNVRDGLWALMGAVAFVLLIASANVARLLLARGLSREGEFRLRASLGASRADLARTVVAEGVIIAAFGTAVGVGVAQASLLVIRTLQAASIPRLASVTLDLRVTAFALGAALLAILLSAVIPGVRASSAVLTPGASANSRVIGAGPALRLQDRVVMAQMALAVVVVIGASFMIQSFRSLMDVPLGFESERLLTLRVAVPRSGYATRPATQEFWRRAEARVQRVPGVVSVSGISLLPLTGDGPTLAFAYDEQTARNWETAAADFRRVSPGLFKTMGITLVAGREFVDADVIDLQQGGTRKLVIDTALAKMAFPGRSAIGERLQVEPTAGPNAFAEVIGVVNPIALLSVGASGRPQAYQSDVYSRVWLSFVIRTTRPPQEIQGEVRRALLELTPDIAVQDVRPMTDVVQNALAPVLLATKSMSMFGLISVALAGLGMYAALAYSVALRTRELGIRLALGETPGALRNRVLRQGFRLAAISLVFGGTIAVLLAAAVRVSLYGVRLSDPQAYAMAMLILGVAALVACWFPASRASRVDPLVALRHD